MHNLLTKADISNVPKWQKTIIYLLFSVTLITLWLGLFGPITDGDIWFHLLYGKSIVENFTLSPDHTVYSWTPSSNSTIYCAWIAQSIYYFFYKIFGNWGIVFIRYFAATILFIAIAHLSLHRKTFYNPVTWFTAILCTLITTHVTLDKPEIFTFAFMVIIVWNFYYLKLSSAKNLFNIYLFPLIILCWVNTHGGFVIGCLFILCAVIGETFNQLFHKTNALPKKIFSHFVLASIISFFCIFFTPYGFEYIYQIVENITDKSIQSDISNIRAYLTTFKSGNPQIVIFANIAVCTLLVVFFNSLKKKDLDFVPIISNLVFVFLFSQHSRLSISWVAVFSLSIVYYCGSMTTIRIRQRVLIIAIFTAASLVLSGWLLSYEKKNPTRGSWLEFGINQRYAPQEGVDFIQNNYKDIKLGNMYNHGAYILWKLWPQTQVMIDARYFPYKEWANEYFDFRHGNSVEDFIKKYPFKVFILAHHDADLKKWFTNSDYWNAVYYGKSSVIFAHTSEINQVHAMRGEIQRGKNLLDVDSLFVAANILHTSIMLQDWQGADEILNYLRNQFRDANHQPFILGINNIKLAAQMYERELYAKSLDYLAKAQRYHINEPHLHSAVLHMKAIKDWQDRKWINAIKGTFNAMGIKDTFTTKYNLALMAWQLEAMYLSNDYPEIMLSRQDLKTLATWREIFSKLVSSNENYPKHYTQYIENAKNILDHGKALDTQLLKSDY